MTGLLSTCYTGRWEHALHTEVESICAEIASDSTMFHLKDTQVLLSNNGCHGLPDNSTVHSLVDMAAGEGEDLRTRKKKDKKQVNNVINGACSVFVCISLTKSDKYIILCNILFMILIHEGCLKYLYQVLKP